MIQSSYPENLLCKLKTKRYFIESQAQIISGRHEIIFYTHPSTIHLNLTWHLITVLRNNGIMMVGMKLYSMKKFRFVEWWNPSLCHSGEPILNRLKWMLIIHPYSCSVMLTWIPWGI